MVKRPAWECSGPNPGAEAWDTVPPTGPCREMVGLWVSLLEPDEERRLMKAISTVGSGLGERGF